nr:EAL domain-containing protein [Pseudomonadota bacterium]
ADEREGHRRDLAMAEEVKAALHARRLVMAWQPVVNAAKGDVEFYECLLRLVRGDGTIVPAAAFIPVVERLGLARLIDRHVLETVVQELLDHSSIILAMNISGYTALDRGWLKALTALVQKNPSIAPRLIIEITETAAVTDVAAMADFVRAVRRMGIRVAIDDFGAGYTTFQHLRNLPADFIKIDGSYIRDLATNAENRLFVRNLTDLGTNLGMATVAECVESADDARILKQAGVQLLQGYYFGKPGTDRPWLSDSTGSG